MSTELIIAISSIAAVAGSLGTFLTWRAKSQATTHFLEKITTMK